MNKKREAREFCFQYFFHLQLPIFRELKDDLAQEGDSKTLQESINTLKESTNTLFDESLNSFITSHVKSTLANYNDIEELAKKYLKNWKLNRLSRVDNTILLLAINEIVYLKDTPINVVINEAIEISKKFGNEDSGKFINGVLDSIAKNEN